MLQTISQAFIFGQLSHALFTGQRQLAFKLGHPGFKHAVRIGQLGRHLIEQRERLLKLRCGGGRSCQRHGRPGEVRDRGLLGGLGHDAYSLG